MHRDRTVLAAMISVAIVAPALAAQATYVNPRFGTSIVYPAEIFTQRMNPSENGDGQSWQAPDGGTLLVFGQYNIDDDTPKSLAKKVAGYEGRKTTYSKTGRDWVVVSGIETGSVFYERYEFGRQDVLHTVVIGYPVDLKSKYDKVAARIAASLQGP